MRCGASRGRTIATKSQLSPTVVPLLQVLARYGEYGDSILGRFGVKDDGHKIPSVRAVIKPLIGLFYSEPAMLGEAGRCRWRNAFDLAFMQKPSTYPEVMQAIAVNSGFWNGAIFPENALVAGYAWIAGMSTAGRSSERHVRDARRMLQ